MELKGEYRIPAPRERVWAMLNDPNVLRECIPGCESLEGSAAEGFAARVTTKVGPVKATFNGQVTLSNVKPPESYTISGEGKGGVAGFAKGGADVHLAEDGAGTLLTYTVNAQVGGKLAQLGSRLIDSTSKKLADQFFSSFAAKAGGGASPDGAKERCLRPRRRSPRLRIRKAWWRKSKRLRARSRRRSRQRPPWDSSAGPSSGACWSSWRCFWCMHSQPDAALAARRYREGRT